MWEVCFLTRNLGNGWHWKRKWRALRDFFFFFFFVRGGWLRRRGSGKEGHVGGKELRNRGRWMHIRIHRRGWIRWKFFGASHVVALSRSRVSLCNFSWVGFVDWGDQTRLVFQPRTNIEFSCIHGWSLAHLFYHQSPVRWGSTWNPPHAPDKWGSYLDKWPREYKTSTKLQHSVFDLWS